MIDPRYLAGVLDSDGSFTITKRHETRVKVNYTCMIQLTWTENNLTHGFFLDLVEQFGGSYFVGFPSGKTQFPNSKRIIKYCAVGQAANKIANFVVEHLILKKEQARNLLDVSSIVKGPKSGRYRTPQASLQLEKLYIYNKSLNSKNKGNQNDSDRK